MHINVFQDLGLKVTGGPYTAHGPCYCCAASGLCRAAGIAAAEVRPGTTKHTD